MTALTTFDALASSSATLGRSSTGRFPFSNATVVQPILIKVLPTQTREDGRFEIADASGVPSSIRLRFEQVLDRVNVLLAESATPEADVVSSRIAADAIAFAGGAIADSTARTEIFPLADGGLLFRWRTGRGAAEAEFDADGDIVILIEDTVQGSREAGYAADLWPAAVRFVRGL